MAEESTSNPFATRQDLIKFWRQLTTDETDRADMLLDLASDRLRMVASNSGVDLDIKSTADPIYSKSLKFIILESVKRALQTPQNLPPVNAYQQTAGPYTENFTFTNPNGDLWFKKADLALLGIGGNQKISSISGTEADIYTEE